MAVNKHCMPQKNLPSFNTVIIKSFKTAFCGVRCQHKKVDLKYLKHQSESLSAQEKVVVLLLDEVYMAQRVEYGNGSFVR